jgi:hypothetical protein
MNRMKRVITRAALIVLGLTPILEAQTGQESGGPIFCPPIDQFLSPTLLDVLIYPGLTFR